MGKTRNKRRVKGKTKKRINRRIKRTYKKKYGGDSLDHYIVTIHNSNGQQIKDVDISIDYPLDFIDEVEKQSRIRSIVPMEDSYISQYNQIINNSSGEISDDELASVWFCTTSNRPKQSYNINYNGKMYIVKFHSI